MRTIIIIIVSVIAGVYQTMAQNVSGKVVNQNHQPIEAVTVVMQSPDSAFMDAVITDEDGKFVFETSTNHYRLIFQHLLYESMAVDFFTTDAGIITMKEQDYKLNEVIVKGERPLVKADKGLLIYDVDAIADNSTVSNAYEIITRLPGVIEQNGVLTLMGTGEISILVNGKPSSMSSEQLMNLLRNTPVSNVEKAEVMYSAPAKYRVRGAIINVVMKNHKSENNSFRGEIGGGFIQGKYSSGNGSLNLSFVGKKITANVLYSADYTKKKTSYDFISHHTIDNKLYDVEQYNNGLRKKLTHNIRTSLDYKIKEGDNINVAYTTSVTPNIRTVENSKGSLSESSNVRTGDEQMHNVSFDYNLHWGMNVGFDFTHYSYPSLQDFKNKTEFSEQYFKVDNNQNVNRWNVYIGQTHALPYNWDLNYGIDLSFANDRSSQIYNSQNEISMSDLNSNTELNEETYNFYGGIEKTFGGNLSLSLSVAGEYYKLADYKKWAVYPSMQLSYIPSANHIFQLAFSSDKKYPGYWEMQDMTSYINGYSKVQGNPLLRPSADYTANLTYILKSKYMFNLYYTHVKDMFNQLAYQSPDELSMIYQTVNYDYEQNFGVSAIIPFAFGSVWNSRITLDASYFRDVCSDFHCIDFDNSVWRGIAMMNNNFRLSAKPAISLELNGLYVTPSVQGIYDLSSVWKLDAGLKYSFAKNNAELRLTADDIFNSATPNASVDYKGQSFEVNQHADSRYVSLSFTYKFGGFKLNEHKKVDTSRFGY